MHTAATHINTIDSPAEQTNFISWLQGRCWKSVAIISLFLTVWLTALAVVYTANAARHTYSDLQSLRQEHDNLFTEWTQLLLEQSAWTDTGQIEQLAREELLMRMPSTQEAHFLVVGQ